MKITDCRDINHQPHERPLVSFCLFAYNQEKYIEEAVKGAFAQTYSPLEIILSDDCSTDGTYDVLKSLVATYQGPHFVKLYRTPQNIGICSHVNLLWQRSKGVWIFAAAGDDISDPDRVAKVMHLVSIQPKLKLVQTYLKLIDGNGSPSGMNILSGKLNNQGAGSHSSWTLQDRLTKRSPAPQGACFSYSRDLFDYFGPLPDGCVYEDNVINWRAELLGEAAILRVPLVSYRVHELQITQTAVIANLKKLDEKFVGHFRDAILTTLQNFKDLRIIETMQIHDKYVMAMAELWLNRRYAFFKARLESIEKTWPQRLIPLIRVLRMRHEFPLFSRDNMLRSLLPDFLYFSLKGSAKNECR